jgi:hypothetical protein
VNTPYNAPMATLYLRPISLKRARAFVADFHRHNVPPQGWKFGVALADADGQEVAVGIAGRPIARHLDDGLTLEITRICTLGDRNACSRLYGALTRAGQALGYSRFITYTLATEPGSSPRAAGFTPVDRTDTRSRSWSTPTRPRVAEPVGEVVLWVLHRETR